MRRLVHVLRGSIVCGMLFITGVSFGQQSRFKVMIASQVGVGRDTLYIGVNGDGPGGTIEDNTYGLDVGTAFGAFSESTPPPPDPDGNRIRFVDIPGRTEIVSAGSLFPGDFRGFTSTAQVDTYAVRIDGARVEASGAIISWPSNLSTYATSWKLCSRAGSVLTEVQDMLTAQTYTFPATGSTIQYCIIKGGALPVSVRQHDDTTPREFSLAQNFPNPFNPATVIRFTIPEDARVRLEVFNTVGQRVAVVMDEVRNAGTYSAEFEASGIASGVYLYKLSAGSHVSIRKMVVMK